MKIEMDTKMTEKLGCVDYQGREIYEDETENAVYICTRQLCRGETGGEIMKLRDLTEEIREYESEIAYGSETGLWGMFWNEYRDKIEDNVDMDTTDIDIPDADGEVWLAAYAKMRELEKTGEDYELDDLW